MCKKEKILGINIRNARKSKKMTLKELGDKVNLSEQAIGQYERAERQPSIIMLAEIANALNVGILDLLKNCYKEISSLPRHSSDDENLLKNKKFQTYGEAIKKSREEKKMSLKDLSFKSSTSIENLKEIETNMRKPSLRELINISKALNVSVGALGKNDPTIKSLKQLSSEVSKKADEAYSKYLLTASNDFYPLFILILTYMKNSKGYEPPLDCTLTDEVTEEDLQKDNNLLTTSEIENIINKVTDLVEFEIYKIKNSRDNSQN